MGGGRGVVVRGNTGISGCCTHGKVWILGETCPCEHHCILSIAYHFFFHNIDNCV